VTVPLRSAIRVSGASGRKQVREVRDPHEFEILLQLEFQARVSLRAFSALWVPEFFWSFCRKLRRDFSEGICLACGCRRFFRRKKQVPRQSGLFGQLQVRWGRRGADSFVDEAAGVSTVAPRHATLRAESPIHRQINFVTSSFSSFGSTSLTFGFLTWGRWGDACLNRRGLHFFDGKRQASCRLSAYFRNCKVMGTRAGEQLRDDAAFQRRRTDAEFAQLLSVCCAKARRTAEASRTARVP